MKPVSIQCVWINNITGLSSGNLAVSIELTQKQAEELVLEVVGGMTGPDAARIANKLLEESE